MSVGEEEGRERGGGVGGGGGAGKGGGEGEGGREGEGEEEIFITHVRINHADTAHTHTHTHTCTHIRYKIHNGSMTYCQQFIILVEPHVEGHILNREGIRVVYDISRCDVTMMSLYACRYFYTTECNIRYYRFAWTYSDFSDSL